MTAKLLAELAAEFDQRLRWVLSGTDYAQACADNRAEGGPGVCHSHDRTDANMTMLYAFPQAVGREADIESEADNALWNLGWDWWRATTCPYPGGAMVAVVVATGAPSDSILCPQCAALSTAEYERTIDAREVLSEGHSPEDLTCDGCGRACEVRS